MMYHVNPKTGEPGICKATLQCPFGSPDEHFESKAAARQYFEASQETFAGMAAEALAANFFRKVNAGWTQAKSDERTFEMIEENKGLKVKLTENERRLLKAYTFIDFKPINQTLRKIPLDDDYERDFAAVGDALSSLIKEHQENKELRQLYRYLRVPKGTAPEEYAKSLFASEDWSDQGFLSTTEDPGFIAMESRYRKYDFIAMTIITPQGISLQRSEERAGALQSFEKERLLDRGVEFKVMGQEECTFRTERDRRPLQENYLPFGRTDKAVSRKLLTVRLIDKSILTDGS